MVDKIFQILEFATSGLVIVTLYLIPRSYKWWLAYAVNSILFSGVSLYYGRFWFALMGACLCITAIRNYITTKRKIKKDCYETIDSISQ